MEILPLYSQHIFSLLAYECRIYMELLLKPEFVTSYIYIYIYIYIWTYVWKR
jgi:hypothetical protein